jgi:hypothetical protein
MRTLDARARTHTRHTLVPYIHDTTCVILTRNSSLQSETRSFLKKILTHKYLFTKLHTTKQKNLKQNEIRKKKNGAGTCSRQGRTVVLPEARILFLNALSHWRIFGDKMAGLQFRRKQNSHSHTQSVRSTILYVRCWSLFIYP